MMSNPQMVAKAMAEFMTAFKNIGVTDVRYIGMTKRVIVQAPLMVHSTGYVPRRMARDFLAVVGGLVEKYPDHEWVLQSQVKHQGRLQNGVLMIFSGGAVKITPEDAHYCDPEALADTWNVRPYIINMISEGDV